MAADTLASALSSTSTTTRNPTPTTSSLVVATRTFDGTGNNLLHTQWGSTGEELLRKAAAEYGDGISTLAGADRPSARVISNAIAAQDPTTELSDRDLSAFIYVWGQFLDHDIDLTSTGTTAAGVAVPTGDAQFDPIGTGTQTISFFRSLFNPTSGTSTSNPREQITDITSWIDGSMVYGSDKATADSLRTFVKGQLKTTAGNLLPTDSAGNFLAGDVAREREHRAHLDADAVRARAQSHRGPACSRKSDVDRRANLPAGPRASRRGDPGHHLQGVPARAAGAGCAHGVSRLQRERRSEHRQRVFDGRLPAPHAHQRRRRVLRQRRPRRPRRSRAGRGVLQPGVAQAKRASTTS